MRRLVLLTAALSLLGPALPSAPARAEFSVSPHCAKISDEKEKDLCQRREVEKMGPMYFSMYEPGGQRHRVRLEHSANPCRDVEKDGEFHIYRNPQEKKDRTPYRVIRCKAGKLVASESRTPPPKGPPSPRPPKQPVTIKPPES